MKKIYRNTILVAIVLISTLMHYKHFSKDLMSIHVWRQTQTQSTIINFYEEDMNIFNPRRNDRGNTDGIFRMEFPLMQWLVACFYKVFGNHLIISRIFMFIIGLISILGIYKLLYALFHNVTLAVIGAWTFNFSPSFYYYTINPLPDNLALCFGIWGLALFFIWMNQHKMIYLFLSSLALSFAALCKLPFIIYFIVPIVYFSILFHRKEIDRKLSVLATSALSLSILPILWYIQVVPQWKGNVIVRGILDNKESVRQLLDYYQHNLICTLPELLINYGSMLFFLAGFYFLFKRNPYRDMRFILLLALSIVVLLYYFFEANAIAKVHDYYLFPFYPLLFVLVSYGSYNLLIFNNKLIRYISITLLLILPLTCYLRMQVRWNPDSPGFNKDLLIHKSEIRDAVPKDALVIAGNDNSHFIFFYYIDKKGWGFNDDNLTPQKLKSMIEKGAEYIYTDSEKIINNQKIAKYFEKHLLEKGSIKIIKLKSQSQLDNL